MVKADVEPDRRIERAVLVEAKPSQFIVEDFAVGGVEIAVGDAPIGDGAADAVDQLAHRGFALGRMLFAVKILRHDDFGGQHGPGLRHFDVFLLEDDFAAVVGDFGGAAVPFDLVEGLDLGVAEDALDGQMFWIPRNAGTRAFGREWLGAAGRQGVADAVSRINHGRAFASL